MLLLAKLEPSATIYLYPSVDRSMFFGEHDKNANMRISQYFIE